MDGKTSPLWAAQHTIDEHVAQEDPHQQYMLAEREYSGETLVGLVLPVSLSLDDHALYLRQHGDLNHSIRWGWNRFSIDGPLLNGYLGVGLAVGNASSGDDLLVAEFSATSIRFPEFGATGDENDVLTVNDSGTLIRVPITSLLSPKASLSGADFTGPVTVAGNATDLLRINNGSGTRLLSVSASTSDFYGLDTGGWAPDLAASGRYAGARMVCGSAATTPHASAQLTAVDVIGAYSGSGNLGSLFGLFGSARNTGAGVVSGVSGLYFSVWNSGAGSITNARTVHAASPTVSAGSIGTAYGVYIDRQKLASGVTNGFGIYQAHADDANYFAGPIKLNNNVGLRSFNASAGEVNLAVINTSNQTVIGQNTTGLNKMILHGGNHPSLGGWEVQVGGVAAMTIGVDRSTTFTAPVTFTSSTSQIPAIVSSPSGQSANLQEWRVDSVVVAFLNASGHYGSNRFYARTNGTASLPCISFNADQDTGLYLSADNSIGFAAGGAHAGAISSSGTIVFPVFRTSGAFANVGPANPAFSHNSDTNTGLFWNAGDECGISTGGTARVTVTNSLVTIANPTTVTSAVTISQNVLTDLLVVERPAVASWSIDLSGGTANIDSSGSTIWLSGSAGVFLVTTNRTASTQKDARLGVPHYSSSTPFLFGLMSSTVSGNNLQLGGGSALGMAATLGIAYAAANNTTTTGTEVFRWDLANQLQVAGKVTATAPIKPGSYVVAALPTVGISAGAIAYATNGRKAGESEGAGTGVPAWYDGTNWKTYYDNTTVAA